MLIVMKLYPKLQFYATMVFPITDSNKQIPNDQGVLAEEGGSLDFLLFSPEDIAIFEEAQAAKVLNG